jgi:succinate dehydrogenase / fumarate reductase cytochrome b subunit
MKAIIAFYNSSVGKKVIMAVTGLMMIGFLVGHMAGNLKTFVGYDVAGIHALDAYAHHLRQLGESIFGYGNFLWILRVGLIAMILLHFNAAICLVARNKKARGQGYAKKKNISVTLASTSMAVGGFVILFFVVFHILHFTTGHAHTHGFIEGQVYQNVFRAFQHGWVISVYSVAMIFIGLHLYHGAWSMFQTLGIESRGWNKGLRIFAKSLAIIVTIGFLSVPWSIFAGKMPEPTGTTIEMSKGSH